MEKTDHKRVLRFRYWTGEIFITWGFDDDGWFKFPVVPGDEVFRDVEGRSEQCIGLKDSTGKWVFDGDIKLDPGDGEEIPPFYCIMTWIQEWSMFAWLEVGEWELYQLQGVGQLDTTMYWSYPADQDDVSTDTVVGNIHQNADLLVGKLEDWDGESQKPAGGTT
jgi:hypothetical protein